MESEPKREIKVFNSFAEADEADAEYYRSLSGNERLKIMLQIMAPYYEAIHLISSRGVRFRGGISLTLYTRMR